MRLETAFGVHGIVARNLAHLGYAGNARWEKCGVSTEIDRGVEIRSVGREGDRPASAGGGKNPLADLRVRQALAMAIASGPLSLQLKLLASTW